MDKLLKGSCVSVSLGDVDGNGVADVTIAVKVGGFLDIPPITINLDVGDVVDNVAGFVGSLLFGGPKKDSPLAQMARAAGFLQSELTRETKAKASAKTEG